MTTIASPHPTPAEPVPLDTIPISPAKEDGEMSASDENAKPATNGNVNGDNVTVFHDPDNFTVIHPLMNTWTLWFTKPPSGKVSHHYIVLQTLVRATLTDLRIGRQLERSTQRSRHL